VNLLADGLLGVPYLVGIYGGGSGDLFKNDLV